MKKLMNLLRNSFFLFGLGASTALANQANTICLTGRIEKILPSYAVANINAAKLALIDSNMKNKIKTYYYNNTPMAPLKAYNRMVRDGCSAIIGFAYLSDLKLIGIEQSGEEIPILTSYASNSYGHNLPKNIFLFKPTYDYLAEKMISYVEKKHITPKNYIILTEINRESMLQYKIAYMNVLKQRNIRQKSIDFIKVDVNLIDKIKHIISVNRENVIILLAGTISSAHIADRFPYKNNLYIGTENFGSSSAQSFYERIHNKKINSFFIRNLDYLKGSALLNRFKRRYEEKYLKSPLILSAYTYDATRIIANSLNGSNSISPDSLRKTDYKGVTGIQIKNRKIIRSKNFVIMNVTLHGYRYESP